MDLVLKEPTIADRLKELRINKNITQQELADTIGVSRVTIGSYEKGSASPQIDALVKVAKKYSVSIDWLCGLDGDIDANNLADLAKRLLNIDDLTPLNIKIVNDTVYDDNGESYLISDFYLNITDGLEKQSTDYVKKRMKNFLQDWKKMKELRENHTIDNEVYQLWVEKTLNNLSHVPFESQDSIAKRIQKEWEERFSDLDFTDFDDTDSNEDDLPF